MTNKNKEYCCMCGSTKDEVDKLIRGEYGYIYQNNDNEEKRKVGRPQKIDPRMMLRLKQVYSGTKANKRHLQNHYYQMCSVMPIIRYNTEHPIDNFSFLYKDDVYMKETIFTELGRTEKMLEEFFTNEEAEQYIINMATTTGGQSVKDCKRIKKRNL